MDTCIDIQSRPWHNRINKRELSSLLIAFGDRGFDLGSIDPVQVTLLMQDFVSPTDINETRIAVQNSDNAFMAIFPLLIGKLRFGEIIYILEKLGQHVLVRKIIDLNSGARVFVVRTDVPNNNLTKELYHIWKNSQDDGLFIDIDNEIKKNIDEINRRLSVQADYSVRQQLLDRKIVLCVLRYQKCDTRRKKEDLLNQLCNNVPNDVDRRSLDVVLNGKRAITAAKDNRPDLVEEYIKMGWEVAERCLPCFAVYAMVHDILYSYRNLFNFSKSRRHLDKVVEWGHIAWNRVQYERDNIRISWSWLYLQYVFLSLLRINSVFGMEDTEPINRGDLAQAKAALDKFGQILAGIPARRKMIYSLARARYYQLTDDHETAITYAKEAVKISDDGSYFGIEEQNIRRYCNELVGNRGTF